MKTRGQGHCFYIDPGLSSYFDNFKHLFKSTGPVVTKFHTAVPWAEGIKVCSNSPGHMISWEVLKVFSQICSNDDLGLT